MTSEDVEKARQKLGSKSPPVMRMLTDYDAEDMLSVFSEFSPLKGKLHECAKKAFVYVLVDTAAEMETIERKGRRVYDPRSIVVYVGQTRDLLNRLNGNYPEELKEKIQKKNCEDVGG